MDRFDQIFCSEPHQTALMNTIRSPEYTDHDNNSVMRSIDGISSLKSLFSDILNDLEFKNELKKGEDSVKNALYICILDILKDRLGVTDFKYPTQRDFMVAYGEKFEKESDTEKGLLWKSANWMWILFKMVRPNANQGLALPVVTKFVEGWNGRIILFKNIT